MADWANRITKAQEDKPNGLRTLRLAFCLFMRDTSLVKGEVARRRAAL